MIQLSNFRLLGWQIYAASPSLGIVLGYMYSVEHSSDLLGVRVCLN